MCSRVSIVTACEVTVVGRKDGIRLALLHVPTIPLPYSIVSVNSLMQKKKHPLSCVKGSKSDLSSGVLAAGLPIDGRS